MNLTYLGALDGRERVAAELGVDIPSAQVVHNHNVVTLVAQVQRRGPSAEPVSAQHDHLLLRGVSVGTVRSSIEGCAGEL